MPRLFRDDGRPGHGSERSGRPRATGTRRPSDGADGHRRCRTSSPQTPRGFGFVRALNARAAASSLVRGPANQRAPRGPAPRGASQ